VSEKRSRSTKATSMSTEAMSTKSKTTTGSKSISDGFKVGGLNGSTKKYS